VPFGLSTSSLPAYTSFQAFGNRTSTAKTRLTIVEIIHLLLLQVSTLFVFACSISVQVTAFCNNNWYDPDCTTNCVAQDACDGHYTCDPNNGAKICNRGWSGVNCDQPDFNLINCSQSESTCMLKVFRSVFPSQTHKYKIFSKHMLGVHVWYLLCPNSECRILLLLPARYTNKHQN
jgi:hypothetical protein